MLLAHGWVPITVQATACAALFTAIGWRSRMWRLLWVPVAVLVGVAFAIFVRWYIGFQGWAQDSAPFTLWLWVALTGLAACVLIVGWRGIRWWRRALSILSVPLSLLCAALAMNMWVGYFPTVQSAWDRLTGTQPPRWIDQATVAAMQRDGVRPTQGVVVSVTIPADASGFAHRQEFVYLPPAWFSITPPPRLPAVMMIGAEFGRPDDWLHGGDVLKTIDEFAATHRGNVPVMVFVDQSGAFSNDTECVNGPRGNAADHLTKDVVPYMVSNFGVSSDPANWGVAGWSAGGTCALTLAVMHPELFSAFLDIDGQMGPNAGTRQQTTARLFGGDAEAWASFDPETVIAKHGLYKSMSGWFAVSVNSPTVYRAGGRAVPVSAAELDDDPSTENHAAIANELCLFASSYGIECVVVSFEGTHDFPSAGSAFSAALPWIAGRLGTPGVHRISMPGA